MRPHQERTGAEWFVEAARCYVEGHQGCPWCGGSHRVYKTERDGRLEYYCSGCDFYASHDSRADAYVAVPGEAEAAFA